MANFIVMKLEKDNVATAMEDLAVGTEVTVNGATFKLLEAIPFGHKFAIRAVTKGEPIMKYGQVIGTASQEIAPGEHAHVRNIESNRGRGDKVDANS